MGRQLAHRLGLPFVDLDHRIEQTLGTSIRQYFETEGEERFRDQEAQILAQVAAQPGGMVLSTGGGAVLRSENRQALRHFGSVLYLRASPEFTGPCGRLPERGVRAAPAVPSSCTGQARPCACASNKATSVSAAVSTISLRAATRSASLRICAGFWLAKRTCS